MIQTVRGVRDIPPEETDRWRFLEECARRLFVRYGYRELRTPIFEKSELFARAVGETSDIVEKEMYVFEDRGGDSLCLRPEGTASAVRSFIETARHRSLPWRVFYMGPMFRYERPQKGRFRQFHQIGCELFGPEGPLADAEMMAMALRFFEEIGVQRAVSLEINSLGCPECRGPYRQRLTDYLEAVRDKLCANCQNRLLRNPLRVLDCKEEGGSGVLEGAPRMKDCLCQTCDDHFQGLRAHLDRLRLPYRVNPLMVRGLDYYHRTAFEALAEGLGAQNAVAAGGRYDGLVKEMGGVATPAIGFAMGLERLLLLLDEARVQESRPDLFLLGVGGPGEAAGLQLAERLREAGLAVEMHLSGGSMKSGMKHAGRSGAPLAVIIGEREAESGMAGLKDMATGEQETLNVETAVDRIQQRLKKQGD
ncbi:MAG: histidine--tRNA ligase [Magnetococcales bacterium]|nr:histidine--tRNA ligase [Magnetococcales bacterium]